MIDVLLHDECTVNPSNDMELVKSNKRRLLELQREYYEKKEKEIERRKKEETAQSTKKTLTDIEQAKENKKRMEEIQAKYFLSKYDIAKARANKIRMHQIQQLFQHQKGDLQLVQENKERYREIQANFNQDNDLRLAYQTKELHKTYSQQKEDLRLVSESQQRREDINETYENQKSDLELVKEKKLRRKEIQQEFDNQKSDMRLVKEKKQKYQDIQSEARRRLELNLSMQSIKHSPKQKPNEKARRPLSQGEKTIYVFNMENSSLEMTQKGIENASITNCRKLSISLSKEIAYAKIEDCKSIEVILPNHFEGRVEVKKSSNVTLSCETKEVFHSADFSFDRSEDINIKIKKG